jgi:hypothetical protein
MTQYRMLKAGEIIKDGDEFGPVEKKNTWLKAGVTIGYPLELNSVGYYRRRIHSKIKAKEAKTESPKYRFLAPGERIVATDETNLMSREWCNAYTYNNYVVSSVHPKNFRRKIEAKQEEPELVIHTIPVKLPKSTFLRDMMLLINRHSQEDNSNTPDFILAEFLKNALEAFDNGVRARDQWYGIKADERIG